MLTHKQCYAVQQSLPIKLANGTVNFADALDRLRLHSPTMLSKPKIFKLKVKLIEW